jgi:WD40 repeat protein
LIHLWDDSTGQPLRVIDGHTGPVGHLAFSPTATVLASGGINEDTSARLWEVNTGQRLGTFSGDAGYPLASLTFSPDGHTLAGGGLNGVILHDAATGAIRHLSGHSQPVLSVTFSPDGRRLASGSFDETVIIWDAVSGKPLHTLPGHTLGAATVAFGPDGQWLITGDQQDKIRGWSVDSGQLLQTIEGRGQDLALSQDGRLLAYKPTIDTFALWDIAGNREVFRYAGERPLTFSPDGRLLAVGAANGMVTVWGIK